MPLKTKIDRTKMIKCIDCSNTATHKVYIDNMAKYLHLCEQHRHNYEHATSVTVEIFPVTKKKGKNK